MAEGAAGPVRVCVFDAYGTLFDVGAAARQAAAEPEHTVLAERWPALAQQWRTRQLEYTWLRTIADAYVDFWQVTQEALDWTLAAEGLATDAKLRARLLDLYWELAAFPEVADTLDRLRGDGYAVAILSNGTKAMLAAAIGNAGLTERIDRVLSVEDLGVYKPDRRVYGMVEQAFSCTPREVAFVSSNGWDAAAGTGYGFCSIWVNRDSGPVERLPWTPTHELGDLTAVPEVVTRNGARQ